MRTYLAGPIFGKSDDDAIGWRNEATDLLIGPVLNPMSRDYRGSESDNVAAIVEGDLQDIARSDAMLVNALHGPSWGTAMEVRYAATRKLLVVVIAEPPVSPWLQYHAHAIVPDLASACEVINGWESR